MSGLQQPRHISTLPTAPVGGASLTPGCRRGQADKFGVCYTFNSIVQQLRTSAPGLLLRKMKRLNLTVHSLAKSRMPALVQPLHRRFFGRFLSQLDALFHDAQHARGVLDIAVPEFGHGDDDRGFELMDVAHQHIRIDVSHGSPVAVGPRLRDGGCAHAFDGEARLIFARAFDAAFRVPYLGCLERRRIGRVVLETGRDCNPRAG
jgi:hypothetical protein